MLKKILLIYAAIVPATCLQGQNREDRLSINFDRESVFNEVVSIVEQHFFDPEFDADQWKTRTTSFRSKALGAETLDAYSDVINGLLATLKTSHTFYFSQLNPRRYQLLGIMHEIFEGQGENLFVYEGIGIRTQSTDNKIYVTAVYDGFPAKRAGLRFGDQIITVNGQPFHRFASFFGKAGSNVTIDLIRKGVDKTIQVEVEKLDGRTMFESALDASATIIERNDQQIGYLHVWSYAGLKYHEQIRSLLLWGKLSRCDALILDLRDGWGGADVNYLNLFRSPIVDVQSSSRTRPSTNFSGVWNKPVILLTNGKTTSGKELFAFGFRKLKLGIIVGEKTAGAVVAGRCFLLSNGDLLYLAVMDIKIDGKRLEGVGVQPDIEVARPIQQASKMDPQLERAVELLLGE